MDKTEAFELLDMILDRLGLRSEGETLLADEVMAMIWNVIGEKWGENLEKFCLDEIDPCEFLSNCRKMIEEFKAHLLDRRFEKRMLSK